MWTPAARAELVRETLSVSSGRRGRPRQRPDKLHADKAYVAKVRRQECRACGITLRIARRGVERSDRLGRHR